MVLQGFIGFGIYWGLQVLQSLHIFSSFASLHNFALLPAAKSF